MSNTDWDMDCGTDIHLAYTACENTIREENERLNFVCSDAKIICSEAMHNALSTRNTTVKKILTEYAKKRTR